VQIIEQGNLQVLQVAARELLVRNNLDLSIANLRDRDGIAEVAGAAFDLYAVVEELLEGGNVEDLVVGWLGGVDDELLQHLVSLHSMRIPIFPTRLRRRVQCNGQGDSDIPS
jgi:hypothetical protein